MTKYDDQEGTKEKLDFVTIERKKNKNHKRPRHSSIQMSEHGTGSGA